MELESLYKEHQSLLISIAYRMLGSLSDAEDIVQDSFIAMGAIDEQQVKHSKAYLIKMVTNRCLNLLGSARVTRETYIGPWLPEPLVVNHGHSPIDSLLMKEDLSYAVLVMLQKLTPVERALVILREVLGYEHKEIAGVLNKSETNCRKMYSRLKQNLQQEHLKASPDQEVVEQLVACFIQASETGDFNPFIQQLAPDALLFSDGGGKVRAAIRPIVSKERISAFFHGIVAKGSLAGEHRSLWVNGNKGFVLLRGGIPIIVISFEWNGHNQIQTLYMIVNPDKLKSYY